MRPSWTGRRQSERRECVIKAQARFYDGRPPLDCVITDYSAAGARLVFPADREPPGAFDLHVPSRGDTRHAVLRWKAADAIGVEFIKDKVTTDDQRLIEVQVRMTQIEEELRALRADAALLRANGASVRSSGQDNHADADDLRRRVLTLETRNDEMLVALKQTLTVLADLRNATVPERLRTG